MQKKLLKPKRIELKSVRKKDGPCPGKNFIFCFGPGQTQARKICPMQTSLSSIYACILLVCVCVHGSQQDCMQSALPNSLFRIHKK